MNRNSASPLASTSDPAQSAPRPARRTGAIRRFLPEIGLLAVMVALAIALRAVAFFH